MFRRFLIFALVIVNAAAFAQTDSVRTKPRLENRAAIKVLLSSFVFSKLPQYVSEVNIQAEYRVARQHSLQFGLGVDFPGPVQLVWQGFGMLIAQHNPYWFFGGTGSFAYRYYLQKNSTRQFGFYTGVEVSATGLVSQTRRDREYGGGSYGNNVRWTSPPYRARAVMSNYNVVLGYHTYTRRKVSIDVGISVGYRYHYFWREYPDGNHEYNSDFGNQNIYGYYKKVPIGGAINFSVGKLL